MTDKDREEFILMKADVNHTKNDIIEIKKDLKVISENMAKITRSLFNDEETGEQGVIQITRKNSSRLHKLENIKVAMLLIYGSIWAGIGWLLKTKF
jgi:hypothetical protein